MQRRSVRGLGALLSVFAATFVASCSSDEGATTGPRVAILSIASGNNQSGPIGGILAQPLVASIKDQHGNPVADVVVVWEIEAGSGIVSPDVDTTDSDGLARTTFRLGGSLGVQTVSATLAGLQPVTFTANATTAPPSKLTIANGDGQTGSVGAVLGTDIQVRVTDAFDNVKAGVPVTFAVTAGGGSLSSTSVLSDASGNASVKWTLGTVAGPQTVIAGAGSLTPATFGATATPGAPAGFVLIKGNGQQGNPGAVLPDSLAVRLVDQFGNGIPSDTITWTVSTNGGIVNPTTTVTNSSGRGAVKWTLGPTGGPKTVTATAGSAQIVLQAAATVSYTTVSTGGRHSCALGVGGVIYCWGLNGDGELGIGTLPVASGPVFSTPQPANTSGNVTFRAISTGTGHSCAVALTGEAYCWGTNLDGRLGQTNHTSERLTSPTQVKTTYTFTTITSGRATNCGIGFSTRPVCWGSNHDGEAGVMGGITIPTDSQTIDFPNYVNDPVFTLGASVIAEGGVHGCAVTLIGSVYCWGNNTFGQLGNGGIVRSPHPVLVAGTFMTIAAGGYHTCALDAGGAAFCWGLNTDGQLGTGTLVTVGVPTPVVGGVAFASLTAGGNHTCGLTADGTAYCWGRNGHGQLGDGSVSAKAAPTAVLGGISFIALSAGESQTCGVSVDNVAYCWGDNEFGALGDGTLTNRTTPTKVAFQQ